MRIKGNLSGIYDVIEHKYYDRTTDEEWFCSVEAEATGYRALKR